MVKIQTSSNRQLDFPAIETIRKLKNERKTEEAAQLGDIIAINNLIELYYFR
jgi:hypothetical protein